MLASLLAATQNVEYDTVTGNVVPYLGYGEVFLFALIGFAITFIGIIILIGVVWLCGYIVNRLGNRKDKEAETPAPAISVAEDGIGEEVRVAIVAAIAAYYASENSSCEFKVKRIRKI